LSRVNTGWGAAHPAPFRAHLLPRGERGRGRRCPVCAHVDLLQTL